MPEKTLTPLQIETLRLIHAGRVFMRNVGTAAYRIHGAQPSVVGRLVSMGFARWPKGHVGEQTCELAEAGQSALDGAGGRP